MASYPRQQSNIMGLTNAMIAGYTEHPDFFPNSDVAAVAAARDQFLAASAALNDAQAAAKQAAAAKAQKLRQLQVVTKGQIKISEVDTAAFPERLAYIGWATAAEPRPIPLPSQPNDLKAVAQGVARLADKPAGLLRLAWGKGRQHGRGPASYYILERRTMGCTNGDAAAMWTLAGSSIREEIALTKEPVDTRLEYRVRAVNRAGESEPTNTVAVVL